MTGRNEKEEFSDNPAIDIVLRTLYAIRSSFSRFLIALGVVVTLFGFVLQTGVVAGLAVIIGPTITLYGLVVLLAARLVL